MTESQYRRANRTVLVLIAVILCYFILTMLVAFALEGPSFSRYMRVGTSVAMLVGAFVSYILWKEQKKGAIGMMACATIAYSVIALFGTDTGAYVYAFPVLFGVMAYHNHRLMVIGNAEVIVLNIIRIFLLDKTQLEDSIMAVLTIGLVAYASIKINKLLILFNDENMNTIALASEKQEEDHQKMLQVAGSIIENFDGAMSRLDSLQGNVDTNNFAMTNIAESTDATAQSIQRQADMCVDIRRNTDAVEESMQKLTASSGRTSDMVSQGVVMVENFR